MLVKVEELLENKGWETRKRIIFELETKPCTAYELSKKLSLNYSTVKYHLELLEKFGIITRKPSKHKNVYITTKNIKTIEKYLSEESMQ
ncbi:ArsR/SmtB family transcription factor [Sulfuracidifex tepidarius]|nr:winged helix-turn-helix domain-containing protein [Sulfuracidifex tepidarius]